MKIITTIHLAIGFILAMFCIVTFGYIKQTQRVQKSVEAVLATSDVIREGESAQKMLLDLETGMRGYLLTGRQTFLSPYNKGQVIFARTVRRLDSLTEAYPSQNQLVHLIEQDAQEWIINFSEPLIAARAKVHLSSSHKQYYDSLFNATAQKAKGKLIIDRARKKFELIEAEEEIIKRAKVREMNDSLMQTNDIALGLTLLAILAGSLTAYLLGKTIRKRFMKMTALANSIANGNYQVTLTDTRHDEISSLTHSLNRMAHKLQQSFDHLTKMNRELDQFAYVVSHDLKAPLRAINNLAEWIAEDLDSQEPEITNNLTILRGRVQRMENLINGILEYARVGRKEIKKSTFSVNSVLKEALENLSPPASFQVKIAADMPTLTAEKTLVYQVFSNLLSNAFKYHHTQNGCVEVRAKELENMYQFEVQDDGPGIPKEYHQKVFGIFQTMEARDVKESTGIGLAIVKKIIEEKGGSIWIESDKGQGTTFVFTWPKEKKDLPVLLETAYVS
ncbi:ATP-binding protein [Rufibacter ruber]|uniref:sensor histidine kinase n=1 Tax=Rufibacter ruber TaxID=1783499 RepID=UPI00082CFAAF|nr:ATP-binding protein [Rufibacter ruber]